VGGIWYGDSISRGGGILFWTALALLMYVYAGYPAIAAVRARLRRALPHRGAVRPTVSILVVAYNEEDRIEARIENLLALDYPRDRVEIVIGSDGSTDATVDRARRYERFGVRVHAFPDRRGKPAVLDDLVPRLRGEIVMFADARQRFEASTLRALVENFADPTVGAASGELIIDAPAEGAPAGQGAAFYWRYEKFIRSAESRCDSTVGATGAIYAIRRSLFEPIPADTLLDDVLIPLRIVRRGYRVVFDPAARAYDRASSTARQEFARKARTIAGNFQLFARERWLFDPRCNRLWFATMSHKALRLAIPLLHVAVLVGNALAAHVPPYGWLLAAQLAFYTAAALGCLQRRAGHRPFIGFTIPYSLCLLCWSTVAGFYRFFTDRQPVTWERTPAPAPVAEGAPRAPGIAA
jgi:cellulose synthase/poly-beta-1,6-N-acetylglucosamine synthase-like glycosyltransferase